VQEISWMADGLNFTFWIDEVCVNLSKPLQQQFQLRLY
jgi:hypothetical protein